MTWMRFLGSLRDNQNRKWLGFVAIGITLVMYGAVADAQQTGKSSA